MVTDLKTRVIDELNPVEMYALLTFAGQEQWNKTKATAATLAHLVEEGFVEISDNSRDYTDKGKAIVGLTTAVNYGNKINKNVIISRIVKPISEDNLVGLVDQEYPTKQNDEVTLTVSRKFEGYEVARLRPYFQEAINEGFIEQHETQRGSLYVLTDKGSLLNKMVSQHWQHPSTDKETEDLVGLRPYEARILNLEKRELVYTIGNINFKKVLEKKGFLESVSRKFPYPKTKYYRTEEFDQALDELEDLRHEIFQTNKYGELDGRLKTMSYARPSLGIEGDILGYLESSNSGMTVTRAVALVTALGLLLAVPTAVLS